ncbi:MAG: hypothetical protein OXF95_06595 [Rhodobacteraceae bacterium]|nr:hypothetical protein [Paracoccaceae bacterium]
MATKEDILEQIVEEYLLHNGYFVQHNLKFKPSENHPDFIKREDSNHSDIDVIGYQPRRRDEEKIIVVSCKSWQAGFNPASWINAIETNKEVNGRIAWKSFRELTKPKWSSAFVNAVEEVTGENKFTYVIAVTKLTGDKTIWEQNSNFRQAIKGNKIKILTFQEMIREIQSKLTTSLARTEVGRLLQLFKASN